MTEKRLMVALGTTWLVSTVAVLYFSVSYLTCGFKC